jgi:low temperature requirement protein LtrA
MAKVNPLRGIRVSAETHRVTTFELFFDLVFVFAVTQVTVFMASQHSALGVLQGLVILTLIWWSWVAYSWLANQTHADEGIVRIGMTVAMIAMFGVALTIPEAFSDLEGGLFGPLVLAICYVIVRVVHAVLYIISAGDDVGLRKQVLRTSFAWVVGAGLIIVGAVIGGEYEVWWWLAAIIVDALLTYLTSAGGNWRLPSPAHWTERHGLIVILALGESIVAIGVGAAELPISAPILIGAALGVLLSVGLWWLYFDWIALAAEHILSKLTGIARVTMATDGYTYLHYSLIAGIVVSALGVKEVLGHADSADPLGWFGAAALAGGTSLYLAGHGFFWHRISGRWNYWRLGAATLLLLLLPWVALLPPLAALGLVVVVVLSLVVIETTRYAEQRGKLREAAAI